jgi:hypothetical protein
MVNQYCFVSGRATAPHRRLPSRRIDGRCIGICGEWASDARQPDGRGFSDAPRRTRRAPFDTHRALHRCLRIGGTGITALLITHDAYGAKRDWNSIAVAPTKRTLARLMPTVLFCEIPHASIGVLLMEPSHDGPPYMVIKGRKDTLCSPRMSVEVTPTAQQRVEL